MSLMVRAEEAVQAAERNAPPEPWPVEYTEDLNDRIFRNVLDAVSELVTVRAEQGKRSAWIEPFYRIPGRLHKEPVEDVIMADVVEALEAHGYKDIDWDRRDKRVVLRFKW